MDIVACQEKACNKTFLRTKYHKSFCSRKCWLAHMTAWRNERKFCPVCLKNFGPRKKDTGTTWRKKRYCSLKCGRKAPPWGLKPLPTEERNEPVLTQDEKQENKPVVQTKKQEK